MKKFSNTQKKDPMTNNVSFHGVPMPRGLAFAIYHIEKHGGGVWIYSADRRDSVIEQHNREFGTNLHGQQWLVNAHRKDPVHNAPANDPSQTSHCYFSDGNATYVNTKGKHIQAGGKLPWFMLGIDLEDADNDGRRGNDVNRFIATAHRLGYPFVQPYKSGAEGHHVVLVRSPIVTLERWGVIDKHRSS